ncbi:hypothetical protein KR222_009033, partial [Zaprionus bogoriensis]
TLLRSLWQMPRDDAYTKEAELKNLAKRELANGQEKDSIYKLRLHCYTRGATGIMGLARAFRVMDEDGSKTLNQEEFKNGINNLRLDLTDSDIDDLFKRFDTDGNGTINMTEFLLKLRVSRRECPAIELDNPCTTLLLQPEMSASRLSIIEKAFHKLDKDQDGKITVNDLKNVYSVRDHPKYLSGELSEKEILLNFLKNFEAGAPNPDGVVTREEFINYYATISASIDNDAYFDLVLRRAFKL